MASALFDLEKLTGHALHYDSEHRDLMRAIEEADSLGQVGYRVTQFAESRYNDMSFALDAMREMVDSMAGVEGRKALLYVSDGLPMTPAEDLFHALQHKYQDTSVLSRMRDFDLTRRFARLTDAANTNEVTFYTIDAAGLRVAFSGTAEYGRYGDTPGLWQVAESQQVHNLQSPLLFLAERTGGTAIYNTNDVGDGLSRVAADFGTYYSLGYVPGHSGDGRFHKIEVKTRQKGLRVRHRQRLPRQTDAGAHGRQHAVDAALRLRPEPAGRRPAPRAAERRTSAATSWSTSWWRSRSTRSRWCRGASFTRRGSSCSWRRWTRRAAWPRCRRSRCRSASRRTSSSRRGANFNYALKLIMRPGAHRIAIGIRDEIGAETSFISEVVQVGA